MSECATYMVRLQETKIPKVNRCEQSYPVKVGSPIIKDCLDYSPVHLVLLFVVGIMGDSGGIKMVYGSRLSLNQYPVYSFSQMTGKETVPCFVHAKAISWDIEAYFLITEDHKYIHCCRNNRYGYDNTLVIGSVMSSEAYVIEQMEAYSL